MSAKAISEAKGKELLNKFLGGTAMINQMVTVTQSVNWNQLTADNPWLATQVNIFMTLKLWVLLVLY